MTIKRELKKWYNLSKRIPNSVEFFMKFFKRDNVR